jgi:hypothetical protein
MPEARKRLPTVSKRVKDAAEYLASTPGATLQTAAAHVGWSTWRLREALKKPHNLQYARAVKALAVEALAVSGPATLAKVIADGSNQMAVVAAVKTVESLRGVAAEYAGLVAPTARLPGLQIVILQRDSGAVMQTIGPAQRQIEGEAVPLNP